MQTVPPVKFQCPRWGTSTTPTRRADCVKLPKLLSARERAATRAMMRE